MGIQSGDRNLTWKIVNDVGTAIVGGAYADGTSFPSEAELGKQMGASRTVLREAVKILTAKGLLSARPRTGTWIEPEENWNLLDSDVLEWILERDFSLPMVTELSQMRRAVEPEAACLAAENATDQQLAALKEALEAMKAAHEGYNDPLPAEIAFHAAILRASGNKFFTRLDSLVESSLRYNARLTNRLEGFPVASIEDHQSIYDAIKEGNGEAACDQVTRMIDKVIDLIEHHITDQNGSEPAARHS